MAIAVPTGIKIFNWLATMWGGKIEFRAPMLFCVAFLFQFLVAGLTGSCSRSAVRLAAEQLVFRRGSLSLCDRRRHPVHHLWSLLLLFPKITGRMYSERLARIHFWLFVVGFHLTFDFMHIPGCLACLAAFIRTSRRGGCVESDRDSWRLLSGRWRTGVCVEPGDLMAFR